MPIVLDGTTGVTSPGYGAVSGTTGTFSGNVTANGIATELRPLVLGTAQASTSGTSIDFTGIPSWVKRITVMFRGVSMSGTSSAIIQLGDSGGVEATGYNVGYTYTSASASATAFSSTGFVLAHGGNATAIFSGSVTISLLSGTTWVASGTAGSSNAQITNFMGGDKTLSDTLDRIRITSGNGTDTFDAGTINIAWE